MRIGVVQFKPIAGNIETNITKHVNIINHVSRLDINLIYFPELSLTGYEPQIAKQCSLTEEDARLKVFQDICEKHQIIIGIGLPIPSGEEVLIGQAWFQPNSPRLSYKKQFLHPDEFPYFIQGEEQVLIKHGENQLAPAICYESLQLDHIEQAIKLGANVYMASVAKSVNGVEKAKSYYPSIAKRFEVPVLMANSIGPSDNFISAGQTAVWNKRGNVLATLNEDSEGIIIFDTELEQAKVITI